MGAAFFLAGFSLPAGRRLFLLPPPPPIYQSGPLPGRSFRRTVRALSQAGGQIMPLPDDLRHMDPMMQGALIRAAENELAEAAAWSNRPMKAGDRVKLQANLTREKKRVWQAKHGFGR
jgi:hypothetical protein